MKLIRDESCVLKPGDYGAKIVDDELHIPVQLYDIAQKSRAHRNVKSLASLVTSFPTVIAKGLGWELDQVASALDALRALLEG